MPGTEDQQRRRERRFAALYQEHYRPILAYAVRRVAPAEDAADVVADVFTTAWRRIDQVPEAPADRLWLYGVAQRVIGGRRRSARRLLRLTARLKAAAGTGPLSEPGPGQPGPGRPGLGRPGLAQPGLRDATADHLLAALDQLTPAEREALQLVLWEQLSHAEAAQVLGCSANAVAIRVHRAKTRLRSELCRTGLPGTGLSGSGPSGSGLPGTGPSGTGLSGSGQSGTETASTRASSTRARIDRS